GRGEGLVLGGIVGPGCGGGISVGGRVLNGAHGITGEWGHNPLPAPTEEERKLMPDCYCGKASCIEAWISGTGLANDYKRRAGRAASPHDIAAASDPLSKAVMADFYDRFARSLATIVNVLDPDAIVLGG